VREGDKRKATKVEIIRDDGSASSHATEAPP
jgi:hypothetical protein